MASYIRTPTHITILYDDGTTTTTPATAVTFMGVVEAAKQGNFELARSMATPRNQIEADLAIIPEVTIREGVVFYNDVEIHNSLTDRMLAVLEKEGNIKPMALFLRNLMLNPNHESLQDLYDFMEASNLPITDDGHFLAYKRIRRDYTDIHTGKMDNSIGATVKEKRELCNSNRNETCSRGLHFCSRAYLSSFGSTDSRTVVVKINPRDVVSIPVDYGRAKGRACEYVIHQELNYQNEAKMENKTLIKSEENIEDAYGSGAMFMVSALDMKGKFIKKYATFADAAADLNLQESYIRRVANGSRTSTGGYKFSHSIVQIDPETKERIAVFATPSEAAKVKSSLRPARILEACKKTEGRTGGFIWKFGINS